MGGGERQNGMANAKAKADNAVVVRPKQGIKRRGLRALWAAILMQFGIRLPKKMPVAAPKEEKEKEKEKEDATESNDDKNETTWKDIVGGMRPLHLHSFQSPYFISMPSPPPPPPFFNNEIYHDVSLPPSSPKSLSDGMSSRYCSAEDLQILDKSNNDADIVAVDEEGGSDVINTQADEFIANFYEQIRLQRLKSLDESYPQTARSRMVINC